MVAARAISTVESETAIPEIDAAEPSTLMMKSDSEAVVDERASLKMRRTLVPSVDVAAERNVGAVLSTVELLVTEVLLRDAASLPSAS